MSYNFHKVFRSNSYARAFLWDNATLIIYNSHECFICNSTGFSKLCLISKKIATPLIIILFMLHTLQYTRVPTYPDCMSYKTSI